MRSGQLYSELVDRLTCGVMLIGRSQRIEVWNDWMSRASGIAAEQACGALWSEVLSDAAHGRSGQAIRAALTAGRGGILSAALHHRPLLTHRDAPPHSVVVYALAGPEPRALVVVRDATAEVEFTSQLDAISAENEAQRIALRREQDRFTHMTHFDPLTGLANRQKVRTYLAGALGRCLGQDRMGALLLLDLDRFSDVNSSLGAQAADQVLRLVAARLADTVRPTDIVARIGGDEFVVVLEGIDNVDDAHVAAERLLNAFEAPFHVETEELFVSASIGVTVFPADDCTADRLLTKAKTALGLAKTQGGASLQMYSGQMDAEVAQRVSMQAALRHAVQDQSFQLVYQPQLRGPQESLLGVEALLRWSHPERGPVSPGEFIPILEDSGLITSVGAWVIMEACRQGMRWRRAGIAPFRVSVNVSARQFRGTVLQDAVADALSETGFPASDLELELTESLLMKNVDSSSRMLCELKRMGVQVAVDDFGTGYSSLAYLRRFPVDTLKIDRAFTRNITSSPDDLAICNTIISLGKTLELSVLAEGVETEDQLGSLLAAGCDRFQGFYFARPMPPNGVVDWIRARETLGLPDELLADLISSPSAESSSERTQPVTLDDVGSPPEPPAEYR